MSIILSHSAVPFPKPHSACMVVEVHARPCAQDSGHMGTKSRQVARHMMNLVELESVVLQCREEGAWRLERHLHSRMSGKHHLHMRWNVEGS